ncbi:hypothetical protein K2P47_01680 [Patescibacteria group bacterium]|nr:hypothetical protein [Patescibacteria group bacterium]
MKSSETFISNSERDEQLPVDVLEIIDKAYSKDIETITRANEVIRQFDEQLEMDFSRPNLKHSALWHKLVGSGIEGQIYPISDKVLKKINERIIKFVRTELKEIVS